MTTEDDNESKIPGEGAAIILAERHIAMWLEECDVARGDSDGSRTIKEKFLRETLILYGKRRPKVIDCPPHTYLQGY